MLARNLQRDRPSPAFVAPGNTETRIERIRSIRARNLFVTFPFFPFLPLPLLPIVRVNAYAWFVTSEQRRLSRIFENVAVEKEVKE